MGGALTLTPTPLTLTLALTRWRGRCSNPNPYTPNPNPDPNQVAWAVPSGMASVAWRPLPGELGPAPAPNTPEPEPSLRSLRHVAERVCEWGGGLAPLADTRCDANPSPHPHPHPHPNPNPDPNPNPNPNQVRRDATRKAGLRPEAR